MEEAAMPEPLKMVRFVPIERAGRDFDVAFWQELGDTAIFEAAWDLVVTAELLRNPDAELRLQRSITVLKRR